MKYTKQRDDKICKYHSLYAYVLLLIIWQISHWYFQSFVVPSPWKVIEETITHMPRLLNHLGASSWRILLGLTLTLVVGVVGGIAIGWSDRADRLITPIIYLLYPVPRIAFLPVFMILFGLGDTSKVILIFAISVFHILINIRGTIKQLPDNLKMTVQLIGLSQWQQIRYMVIPSIIPTIMTSLKIVVGSSIAALFFAENYATKKGIGYFIMNAWIKADYVEMYSGIIVIGIFGLILFTIIDKTKHILCKWE
ncbi:MAG: ABC transporter permease [Cellulosilyticaceae bacterium]